MQHLLLTFAATLLLVSSQNGQSATQVQSSDSLLVMSLYDAARSHYTQNSDTALVEVRKGLQLSRQLNFDEGLAEGALLMADIWTLKNESDSTLAYLDLALKKFKLIGLRRGEGQTTNAFGSLYDQQGNYVKAMEYHLEAKRIFDELDYKPGIAKALAGMATVYYFQRRFEESERCYRQILEYHESINDSVGQLEDLGSLISILMPQRKVAEASKLAERSLELLKDQPETAQKARALLSLSSVQKYTDLPAALATLEEAQRISENSQYKRAEVTTYVAMIELFGRMGKLDESTKRGRKGLELARKYQLPELVKQILSNLAATYQIAGDYEEALNYYVEYSELKDSLLNESTTKQLSELATQYETEKKEQDNQILTQQNEIQALSLGEKQAELQRNRTLMIALVVGLLLLVLSSYLFYTRYQLKRSANEQLEQRNIELKAAKEKAERSEQLMERFIANVSHELRTPMNAVLGMTRLLQTTSVDLAQSRYLRVVRAASNHLLRVINDLLDISSIEANQLKLDSAPFRLNHLIEEVRQTFLLEVSDSSVEFEVDIKKELPEVFVGDAVRIKQILINLVGNALKFTDEGEVVLSVFPDKRHKDAGRLVFEVCDTGMGIPSDRQEEVFQNFTQATADISAEYGGTGLGLAISKQLVELQGGTISVSSKEGVGTTFRFDLPLVAGSVADIENVADSERTHQTPPEKSLSVLIGEDQPFNRELAVETLKKWQPSIHIDLAVNGEEVLLHLEHHAYDLLLLDLKMPKMDGLQVIQHIRNSFTGEKKNIPVLAITASASMREREACIKAGIDGYLSKPYLPEDLIQQINWLLASTENSHKKEIPPRWPTQLLSLELLEKVTGGDKKKLLGYMEMFVEAADKNEQEFQEALTTGNTRLLVTTAHGLKSKTAYFRLVELENRLKDLEALDVEKSISKTEVEQVGQVIELLKKVVIEMGDLARKLRKKGNPETNKK